MGQAVADAVELVVRGLSSPLCSKLSICPPEKEKPRWRSPSGVSVRRRPLHSGRLFCRVRRQATRHGVVVAVVVVIWLRAKQSSSTPANGRNDSDAPAECNKRETRRNAGSAVTRGRHFGRIAHGRLYARWRADSWLPAARERRARTARAPSGVEASPRLRCSRAMRCDSLRSIIEITPRRIAPFDTRNQGISDER